MMKRFYFTVISGAALVLACVSSATAASGKKNILFMISDNQCWFDMGCYGHPMVKTPNLDKLAAEGVRFERGFATTASCGPSRAVMYTGLLTHGTGQYAHPHKEHNQILQEDVVTVFSMLKEAGYRTALVGKDHIRPMEKYPLDLHERRGTKDVIALAKAAETFLSSGDEPFFLVWSAGDPHPNTRDGVSWGVDTPVPGLEMPEYRPEDVPVPGFLPDTPEVRANVAGYYEQITRMDHGAGLVLSALEASGKKDDTLIVFISDHGTSEPGAMGTQYEPGLRIPFIAWHAGLKAPGSVNEGMVTCADLTPTFLDWAGVTFEDYPLHGRSFLSILDTPTPEGWDRAVTSHVGHDVYAHYPMRTLRGKRWKLIWNVLPGQEYPLPIDAFNRATWSRIREKGEKMIGPRTVDQFLHRPRLELYDLDNDPWEVTNLSETPEHRERAERMARELVGILTEQNDPWLQKYHPLRASQADRDP